MNEIIHDDISTKLIHLTRDTKENKSTILKKASENFINIVNTKTLCGRGTSIRGGYNCVCFSEAPISKFAYLFAGERSRKEFNYAHLV